MSWMRIRRGALHGVAKGAVVIVQEIFGVNGYIRSVVDRFAEAGYVAIAPALFDRQRSAGWS